MKVSMLCALLFPLTVFSQTDTTKKNKVLETVILIASPHQALQQMPVSFSELNRKDFTPLHYGQEVSQVLQSLPGVTTYTDNGTGIGYSYLRLRGIDQNRLNISINGLPLNEPEDEGVYFSNFPDLLSDISTIQLQRGPGLSKAGVAGFGGNLDFSTFPIPDTLLKIGFDVGSYNTERLFVQQATDDKNDRYFYSVSGLHSDGYKFHSGNSSGSGIFQWQHKGRKSEVSYLVLSGVNKNGLAWLGVSDSLIKVDPKNNGNAKDEGGNFFQSLQQINYKFQINSRQSFHAAAFYNYTKGKYGFDLMNFLGYPSNDTILNYQTHSNFAGLQAYYNYASQTLNLSAGAYGSLYKKVHDGVQSPGNLLLYHNYGNKNDLALFSKFMYHAGRFYTFADLQYRYAKFSYTGSVPLKNFYWSFFNPLAGITYQASRHTYIYYSVGKTQREPGRNDIFLGNDNLGSDSAGRADFTDLKPELNFSQELGLRYTNKNLQFSIDLYRMILKNEITLNGQIGPTGLPLHSNVAKGIRQGIETEWRYYLNDHWNFYESFAFAPHKVIQDEVTSSPVLTPKVISNFQVEYSHDRFSLILQNRYQDKSYVDFANLYIVPSYCSFNLTGLYSYKQFTFSVRLLNLTNQKIYSDGQLNLYGVPIYHVQAPLNFMMGVEWER